LLVRGREVDPELPFALLPVLALDADALPNDVLSALPIDEILKLALRWYGSRPRARSSLDTPAAEEPDRLPHPAVRDATG
jgi:hypothetical protein